MGDAQPAEVEALAGHPWLARSRWGMAWRVSVALLTATMLGLLVLTVMSLGSGQMEPRAVFGWVTLLVTPTLGGLLALPFAQRLTGLDPVMQGLAFGAMNVFVLPVVALMFVAVQRLFGAGDEADWSFVYAGFLAPPVFLACAVAYPFAIWSTTPRGARVCWSICAVAILLFIAMTVLLRSGVFDRPQVIEPAPPGSPQAKCWRHDPDGKTWEIPCNGAQPYEIGTPG